MRDFHVVFNELKEMEKKITALQKKRNKLNRELKRVQDSIYNRDQLDLFPKDEAQNEKAM